MFTPETQTIINEAKIHTLNSGRNEIGLETFLKALCGNAQAADTLSRLFSRTSPEPGFSLPDSLCPAGTADSPADTRVLVGSRVRSIIQAARTLATAREVPDPEHPGLINPLHLACAAAMSDNACRILGADGPIPENDVVLFLESRMSRSDSTGSLAETINVLRGVRDQLLSTVYGQDHAIHGFIEGLYAAELTAEADEQRTRPTAIFTFAGPPGVGKTYLTQQVSHALKRPFKRFDMTGYSDHQASNQLVGFSPSYKDAHEGTLTGFVEKHPRSVLLFDEIEKAHPTTIQLFFQILDAGVLEDKFTEKNVLFRNTIIIFTTNAGRSLYENPDKLGISKANAAYHKQTIISALENEKSPSTGKAIFPQALCSRLGQGYALMFNHLGIAELERICRSELDRIARLMEKQYLITVDYSPLLPMALILRQGGKVDARQLKAEVETFVKGELFRYSTLYSPERLQQRLEKINRISFEIDTRGIAGNDLLSGLFTPAARPKILLVADPALQDTQFTGIPAIDWLTASTAPEALNHLSLDDIDMVLLDIWIHRDRDAAPLEIEDKTITRDMDFVPLTANRLEKGRSILQAIHDAFPETPVYLLSFEGPGNGGDDPFDRKRPIDTELLLACIRSGGVRGIIRAPSPGIPGSKDSGTQRLAETLMATSNAIARENLAMSLARERRALAFDTSPEQARQYGNLIINLRNFRLVRAIDAQDAGEMIEDVNRPALTFRDVFGAASAKASLMFIVEWMKQPKKYLGMGIRPPRGILLTGSPGTGKTVLARALAGESDCAFIESSASSFVTIWQGSGPQNVRNLFTRARRYAPAIVFIDEIDSIGVKRSGGLSGAKAQEDTLNALLTEMDGFRSQKGSPVIVIAATNLADRLDTALKRRFDRVIEVEKPDRETRRNYLEHALSSRKQATVSGTVMDRIAGQSAGCTIADLESILQSASILAAGKALPVSDAILEEAFETFRSGDAKKHPDEATLRRIACHEAGHAVIAWKGNNIPVQVTIVGRGNAGGFMEREQNEDQLIHTKPDILQSICEAMGGRAAEILYYGEDEGLSTGISGDLRAATHWATRMVTEFGMSDEFGLMALPEPGGQARASSGADSGLTSIVKDIIKGQLERAIAILKNHEETLRALTDELILKNRLTREDLERLFSRTPGSHDPSST